MKRLLLFVFLIGVSFHAFSQGTTLRNKTSKQVEPYEYDYVFPILGQGAADKGFKLPLPHGIMFNFLPMQQFIQISDLHVGFNNGELINLENIVKFDKTKVNGVTYNFRFDTWVLPFLNVYAMYGRLNSKVNVNIVKPIDLTTTTTSIGQYGSIGAMVAGAFGNFFFSGDFNHSWTTSDKLDKPARVLVGSARVGPIFSIRDKPEMNVAFWGGIMYTHLVSETVGSINANEVFPNLGSDVDETISDLNDYYNSLGPGGQLLFKDVYEKLVNGLTSVKDFGDNGTIQYQMQKSIQNPYNLAIGGQWQINLRWQLRTEVQLLGDRTAGLLSLNYRFGIPGKNLFSKK